MGEPTGKQASDQDNGFSGVTRKVLACHCPAISGSFAWWR
jgi:hypothetical protein